MLWQTAALVAGGSIVTAREADAQPAGAVIGQTEGAAAGDAVLAAGGNAVDAAVAAALVAGVVAVPMTGIGGYGGHMVIAKPDDGGRRGKVFALDFNTAAPAAAREDMFPVDERGVVKDQRNQYGWLAAGVPGVLAGLQLALDRFGSKPLAELLEPAIRYAREGFTVNKALAAAFKSARDRLARDPGSAKLFFAHGEPFAEGAKLRNPDLADMLESLAERGRVDDFYRGKIADKIAAAFRRHGALVTADDLSAYRAIEVVPLALDWQGYTIYMPPLTAGGLTVLQALAAIKSLGWVEMDEQDPSTVQARVESLRIAWTDRLERLGDPKHVEVPIERLLSDDYAAQSAERIRAAIKQRKPTQGQSDRRPAGGTIHLSAADKSGMMAALTFTHGNSLGAQVTVDGLGLVLGHGMSRFDPQPGKPNSPGPGKRPLNNMCPTIVARGGKPVMALGATGGRRIVNTVFDFLAYRLGIGRSLTESVQAPRVHTEGDLKLTLEASWPPKVKEHFKKIGYDVAIGPAARLNAIERDSASGSLRSAAR